MLKASDCGFPEGSELRIRYERTGGVIICPKCGKFMGFPKQNSNGVHLFQFRPPCSCGGLGVIKFANKTGVTFGFVDIPQVGVFEAKAKCCPKDTYNKKFGRELVIARLKKRMAHNIKENTNG